METEQIQNVKTLNLDSLPNGWILRKLGSLVKLINGYAFKPEDWKTEGLPIIRIQNLNDSSASYNYFDGQVDERYYINKGDLLFAWSGTKGVSFGARIWKGDLAILNQHIFRVIPLKIDPGFCFYLLRNAQEAVEKNAHGFKSTFVHVTKGDLEKVVVKIPADPTQQRKIAAILSTWDEAIQTAEQLLKAKQERKRGLMQQLLSGQKRLPGFSRDWREVKLGDVFRERNETKWSHLPLLAITASNGVVLRNTLEKRDTSNEDKGKYLRICPGDIGYNTMRMWQGVSGVSQYEGLISPAYTVLVPDKSVDVHYMAYLFKYQPMVHLFWRYSQGLVDDTLNCKYDSFRRIHVSIPSLEEQQAITEVITAADEEIRLAVAEVEALKQQKRGLMQELLTGKTLVTA